MTHLQTVKPITKPPKHKLQGPLGHNGSATKHVLAKHMLADYDGA